MTIPIPIPKRVESLLELRYLMICSALRLLHSAHRICKLLNLYALPGNKLCGYIWSTCRSFVAPHLQHFSPYFSKAFFRSFRHRGVLCMKLPKGVHVIRSRNRLWEITLTQPAIIIDEFCQRSWCRYHGEFNPSGDWTIDIDGRPLTICAEGPFFINKPQLRLVDG